MFKMWWGFNNQIKKVLLLSVWVKKIKSVNIRQSYMQERGCIVHFLCLFSSVSASAQSARDNQSLACNFAKYSPIKNIHSHTQQ